MKDVTCFKKEMLEIIDRRAANVPVVWVPHEETQTSSRQYRHGLIWSSCQDGNLTKKIIELINSARDTVVINSFLLADKEVENAIYDVASCGIRVYLMLACETTLNNSTDDDFGKKYLERHVNMLKRLAGKAMVRSASHYHAKSVLVDAIGSDTSNSRGLLLTANLTSEALERNEELAVELTKLEIEELVAIYKWALFEYAEHQMLDNVKFESVKPLGEVSHPKNVKYIVSTSKVKHSIKEHALKLIAEAKNELFISSFGWEEDHELIKAISDKAKEGTKVKIFARIRPTSMPTLLKLKRAGAEVFGFKWLHAKAIWNDANHAMVMSANLQKHGLDQGFEIGVKLSDERAMSLKKSLLGFLNKKYSVLQVNAELGSLLGRITVWKSNKFQDIDVVTSKDIELNPIIARCATNLSEKQKIPNTDWETIAIHAIRYKWQVKAPVLPKNSKEIFKKEKPVMEKNIDKTAKDEKESKGKKKHKDNVKVPYSPKAYKTDDSRTVIAIVQADEIDAAKVLRDSTFPNANIVLNIQ